MAQGSITKHVAKDGTISWRARADSGIDPATGKRRQIMQTFRIKTDAQAWLRDQQHRADRGQWADARKATLGEWIEEWLAGAGARGRKESTQRVYADLLGYRVVRALGHVPLAKLTAVALERFFRQLEQEARPASAHTIYAVLHVCLADAERLNLIAANPLRHVRAPSAPPPQRRAWTPEEARRLLAAAEAGEDHTLWLVMLTCGLRIGEILALAWDDCDLQRELLHVRRTLTVNRAGDAVIGSSTKSGKPRTLSLAPTVIDALREQHTRVLALRMKHRDVWQDYDLVFPQADGAPRNDNTARRHLRALCRRADVPMLTPHGLRHTAATLLAEHAPVAVARDVLGHSSLSITNRYVHASDLAKRAGADVLARLLDQS